MQLGITKSLTLSNGTTISIETGKLAKQADGSVVLKQGDTMILATVVAEKTAGEDVDFMPLMVDYKENFSATGRIPGGFLRRESRPSDHEVLICRLVDRALRPMFPEDFHANTVVTLRLLSSDLETLPDALVCLAASAAIQVSDIPFIEPISEVRVARIDGEFRINPSLSELATADLDIIIAATKENIVMVEGEMQEVSEAEMAEAIRVGHEAIKLQCDLQLELAAAVGRVPREYVHEKSNEDLKKAIFDFSFEKFKAIAAKGLANKSERSALFSEVKEEFLASLSEEEKAENKFLISQYFKAAQKEAVREVMLATGVRLDGRKLNQIRPIWSEVNYLPKAHGSAVFTRGETQSLTTVTLGSKKDEQLIDGAFFSGTDGFMLHYNFPSFSTGEARMPRGVSRREIGHGNLAHRAIKRMLPADNAYTVRIVSDILESNGSSSMATVCAGTLALMDAGVQITRPVSGIAMGLITDGKRFAVLSDILGDEDHLGDMDFKVTGTEKGITAVQMDIKIDGLSFEILNQALNQAKEGRLHILGEMAKTLAAPNPTFKEHTPQIVNIRIPGDTIGAVIGPGGKIIQEIQAYSGATISITEEGDEGIVQIYAPNAESIKMATDRVRGIVAKPEVGEVYDGVVKSIKEFGAFVEFLPGKQALVHISELSHSRIDKMEDSGLKEGDH
ncbi:MAG: polyribonucleotide nucleotidyltransferase, partial [Chitinophagales bacterium]